MAVLLKYAWIILFFSCLLSAVRLRHRVQPYINANHSLKKGYNKFIAVRMILMLIPVIVIAFGCLSEKTKNILDFISFTKVNVTVIIFHVSVIIEAGLVYYWLFYDNGMRYLKKHTGAVRVRKNGYSTDKISSADLKKLFRISSLSYVIICALLWKIPLPDVHF